MRCTSCAWPVHLLHINVLAVRLRPAEVLSGHEANHAGADANEIDGCHEVGVAGGAVFFHLLPQHEPEDEEAESRRGPRTDHDGESDADQRDSGNRTHATGNPRRCARDGPPRKLENDILAFNSAPEEEDTPRDEDPKRLVALENQGVRADLEHGPRLDGNRVRPHEEAAEEGVRYCDSVHAHSEAMLGGEARPAPVVGMEL
mmetsp:Transcript_65717/g.182956  ORF Transcript_65717/g.182956 Transcript_65717/m.182956 type:complete len:202 (+) Transcript_65717:785-1390(+)